MQAAHPHPAPPFPARLEGHLEQPSRALWLVKWLLVIPHYLILALLWCAFVCLSLIAFVALLFTGRYPRGIFEFNVGVLRWTWRVGFYAFNANGTDRYPPFTFADVPDYPARLEIDYPDRQRRGLPLIGWWLAGIPQYIFAAGLAGGAAWTLWFAPADGIDAIVRGLGAIGVFTFTGAVVLLVRGFYPHGLFDLLLGLNRWVLRVGAYAALMTPEYPPFRLDAGEHDPGTVTISPLAHAATPDTSARRAATQDAWGAGRVTAVVLSSFALLVGLAALAAGGTAVAFDQTQRDDAGYLMTDSTGYSTDTYALVSDSYRTGAAGDVFVARDMLGTVRIRTQSAQPVFVGIARAAAVNSYLAGVGREVATSFDAQPSDFRLRHGGPPTVPPTARTFWSAQSVGTGTQTLTWTPKNGDWRIVVMNSNGTARVHTELAIGARFPHLLWIGIGALGGGVLLLLLGGTGIYFATRRRAT